LPNELETHDEKGDFLIKIKRRNDTWSGLCHTSLDVVGWDGYNFHTVLAFTILSPLQVVCISHHRYIKPSKQPLS
jgi:homogentisate 1,2-dioxygenase